jgi:uncharacterized protein YeaO (DUF488 family)
MPIYLKSIHKSQHDDGTKRFLITWSEDMAKRKGYDYNEWIPALGPTKELYEDFKVHHRIGWQEYKRQFLIKMMSEESKKALQDVANIARITDVTLLCYCFYDEECHRSIVLDLIEQILKSSRW